MNKVMETTVAKLGKMTSILCCNLSGRCGRYTQPAFKPCKLPCSEPIKQSSTCSNDTSIFNSKDLEHAETLQHEHTNSWDLMM